MVKKAGLPERKPPCAGCYAHGLAYLEFQYDAERRAKAGQKQVRCPVCSLWCWGNQLKPTKRRSAEEAT